MADEIGINGLAGSLGFPNDGVLQKNIYYKVPDGFACMQAKGDTIFNLILLAVDASETALEAAKVAGELARAAETRELQILVAREPVPTYIGESNLQSAPGTQPDKSQEILERVEEAIGKVPAVIYSELVEGQITDTVLNLAKTRRSDLIVMGAQGLGRLTGALLGINGQRIVSEAPCPVLVVR